MNFYVYRNFTVENLFKNLKAEYSGYGDISSVPKNCTSYIWFYLPSINMNHRELIEEVRDYQARFEFLLGKIPENKMIIALTAEVFFAFKGINSCFELTSILGDYNRFLNESSVIRSNLKVIDFKEFHNFIGDDIFNWRYYYISQSLINPKYNNQFASWFNGKLDAIQNKRKKCLVLDLDNTLWGGILGEDGIEGIQLGNQYPGLAFYDFQKGLLELYNSGVVLTVCSKNNESDVLQCWAKHPSVLITEKNLSSYRINWVDKPSNISAIANELNIGLDSIVFIDDNPVERERVKFELPMVSVPDFPEQPYLLPEFLKSIHDEYFQIHQLTFEDQKKTQQYKTNKERKVFRHKFGNLDDYLSSLEMELKLFDCNDLNILRISQMTQKTNQFNLTTKRYIEQDLANIKNNNGLINCLSVKDRFGDNGISAASIILIDKHKAFIDSFLLSCRILGRGIEEAYLLCLLNKLVKMGIKTVESEYIPSEKNQQTSKFYENQGFKLIKIEKSGLRKYSLELEKINRIKKYYKFVS